MPTPAFMHVLDERLALVGRQDLGRVEDGLGEDL
jgi:hypothetical protein